MSDSPTGQEGRRIRIYKCLRCGYSGLFPPVVGSDFRCMKGHDCEVTPYLPASDLLALQEENRELREQLEQGAASPALGSPDGENSGVTPEQLAEGERVDATVYLEAARARLTDAETLLRECHDFLLSNRITGPLTARIGKHLEGADRMNTPDGSPNLPYLGQTVLYRGQGRADRIEAAIIVAVSKKVSGSDESSSVNPDADEWTVNLLVLHPINSTFNGVSLNVPRAGLGHKSYEHEPGTWAPLPYGQWDQ